MKRIIKPLEIPNDFQTRKFAIKKYGNFARLVYGKKLKKDCDCETCKLIKDYAPLTTAEKLARKEIKKLIDNYEEIRKLKEEI